MATTIKEAPRKTAPAPGAVPATMKAVALDEFGPPGVLALHTMAVPAPGPTEVLIELHAAGVGVWDSAVREGTWKPYGRSRFPLVPGTDGAGVVALRGARARRFEVGDRVWAYHYANPKGGFYAEYAAVDENHVGRIPPHLDMNQAGAGAATGLTALQGIDDALRVGPRDTVLIFGATGGLGTLAIQFARRRGARVIASATGAAGAGLARKLGADEVFDARASDAAGELQRLAPDGIDAALVLAGSPALEACLDHVRPGGRIAFPHGVMPEPHRRRGMRVTGYDGEAGKDEFERLEEAAEQARLTVPIAEVFPLGRAAAAHERLQRNRVLGRIVLAIRS